MAFEGIHIARSGIAASQRALDVVGHNIANVGTPGHSRLRVEQVSTERAGPSLILGPGANGTGVRITGVERVRDLVLDGTLRSEISNAASADLGARTLERIELALGPLDGGIEDALTGLWNAWDELSLDPTSMTARSHVLDAGAQVARMVQDASAGVTEVIDSAQQSAAMMLDEQNALLEAVAALNGQIRAQQAVGENPNALLDQRDRHLDQLAGTVGATVHHLEDGSVHVSISGYAVVRGTNVSTLELVGTPPVLQTTDGHAITPAGTLGGLLIDTQAMGDQVISDLDDLAIALRDTLNAQHRLGFDLGGNPAGDFFSATGSADLALAGGLTAAGLAASATGEPADGNHAIVLAGIRNQSGPSGTIDEQARTLIGRVGAAVVTARSRAELTDGALTDLRDTRSSISGVNLDEELTMLLQYQRAYEASARVLTSVDEMLDVLINRTGIVGR